MFNVKFHSVINKVVTLKGQEFHNQVDHIGQDLEFYSETNPTKYWSPVCNSLLHYSIVHCRCWIGGHLWTQSTDVAAHTKENDIFMSWIKTTKTGQICSSDMVDARVWEIGFTVNICHQDSSPRFNASYGIWSRRWRWRGGGMVGGGGEWEEQRGERIERTDLCWKGREQKVWRGSERGGGGGGGIKTVICNSFSAMCACINSITSCSVCVCVCWQAVCAHPSMCQAWLATQRCAPA